MNQVNLMNLLYAVPETVAVHTPGGQQASQAEANGMEFLLNLKQEFWAAQMPKVGAGLFTSILQAEAAGTGLITGFSDVLLTEGSPPGQTAEAASLLTAPVVDGTAQGLVTEGKPSAPIALIDALTASLKQAIALMGEGKQPEAAEQNLLNAGDVKAVANPLVDSQTVATSPALLQNEVVEPSQVSDSVELKLFGSRHPGLVPTTTAQPSAAPGSEVVLQSPVLVLADTWRIAAGILKNELLAQGVVVDVSAPELKVAQGSTQAAPWALVTANAGDSAGKVQAGEQTQAQLSKALVANMPRAATPAPIVVVERLPENAAIPQDAPESIRWFAQPTGSGKNANVDVQTQPIIATRAMVSEMEFVGETKLKVSIQPTAQPAQAISDTRSEPIVLDVKVALAGEANAALEAKLTLLPVVRRTGLPQLPTANVLIAEGMPGLTEQGGPARQNGVGNQRVSVPEQPAQLNPSARPISVQQPKNGSAQMVMPMQAEPIVADTTRTDRPQAVQIQAGLVQRAVATNQQVLEAAMAITGEPVTKAVPIVAQLKPGKTTGLQNAKVADQDSASEAAPKAKAATVDLSRASQMREATLASLEQRQTSRLHALSQLGSPQAGTPASELQPSLSPMVGIGTQDVPAQLMQFSSTGLVFKTPSGLNYLELANRLMDKVSAAKTAGNGVHSARLTLNPPSLGQMFVNIAVQGESVALQIAVAAGVSKELLKDSMDALQQSLEESGLEVLEFKVEELGTGQERSSERNQAQATNPANADQSENQFDPANFFRIDPELFGTRVPA